MDFEIESIHRRILLPIASAQAEIRFRLRRGVGHFNGEASPVMETSPVKAGIGERNGITAPGDRRRLADMTRERWQQVKDLLAQVLEVEPSERLAFLDRISGDDDALRAELDELLAADGNNEFLNQPFLEPAFPVADSQILSRRIGQRIGPYLMVEEIGIGGMGEVYRAFRDDDQYQKEVAIKLVRAGQDSGFVLDRFRHERQVLATLEHPNIARLLDGGSTEEGAPYFVMELIDGQPLTEYSKIHGLATGERLELFLEVCSAVEYAHRRLIIHRDLKPSNILVTSEGVPKLLDFGIAKILDPATAKDGPEPTLSLFRFLTPRYASPEQVKGEAITTASDVYSLGVVLYELLTGQGPYPAACRTTHELARAVCEIEPVRPSIRVRRPDAGGVDTGDVSREKLSRRLRGDLDNIVLKALSKEPGRRYATVEQFAGDVRCHLGNLPVAASRGSRRYRASKFVRRHWAGVVATVIVAAAVVAGVGATLYEAYRARVEQLRAERRFAEVRELANSLMFDIYDSIRDLPGATSARKLVVDRALGYLDSLSFDSGNDPSLMRELASAYERVGDVQGFSYYANLGDSSGAMESYHKAFEIRQALAKEFPKDPVAQGDLADSYTRMADSLSLVGEDSKALEKARDALAIRQKLQAADPASEIAQFNLAESYNSVGDLLTGIYEWTAARGPYEKALLGYSALLSRHPDVFRYRRMLGNAHLRLGWVYENTRAFPGAQAEYQQGLEILQRLAAANPANALLERNVANAHLSMGDILVARGDPQGGLRELRQAARMVESIARSDRNDSRCLRDMTFIYRSIGDAESVTGHPQAAFDYYTRALNAARKRAAFDRSNVDAGLIVASTYGRLGRLNAAMARDRENSAARRHWLWERARSSFEEALRICRGFDPNREWTLSDQRYVETSKDLEHELEICKAALKKN
ncbi:MAG: protein kinase [Acidobacteria bacterium]|nr:protein kinase [Acidobacteriota bacterium]